MNSTTVLTQRSPITPSGRTIPRSKPTLVGPGAARSPRRAPRARAWGEPIRLALFVLVVASSLYLLFQLGVSLGMALSELLDPGPEPPRDEYAESVLVWPRPDGWEELGYSEIWGHFKCRPYADNRAKPLPTPEHWRMFREKFKEHADGNAVFDDPIPPTKGYTLNRDGPPPFHAKHGTRGRGLFASRDIRRGELVHDGDRSNVEFPNATAWRRFVFSMPRDRACDNMDWLWLQRTEEGGPYRLLSAIDVSVLFNGANKWNANANPKSSTSSKFYATRDIEKGEELLTNYNMYDSPYEEVGL